MFVTWLRIDSDMVVLSVDGDMAEKTRDVVGRRVFDVYPDGEPLFLDGYRLALKHGHHNFVRLYHGCIVACLCTRVDDDLLVCFKTMPLVGLTESLRAVEAALADPPADF